MDFFIQLLGFIGLFLSIVAFQFKKHRGIVFCKMSSELIFSLQYVLLGAWTAAVLDFISVIRNLLFLRLVKKKVSTTPVIVVFGIFVVITGITTYDGLLSLLPIVAKLLTTVSYGMKNEKLLRIITVPSCLFWAFYNYQVGSYGGAIADLITLVSLLIAMYKYDIKKQPKENTHDPEN